MSPPTLLYVNHGLSEICGVHDLGKRHARAIESERLSVRYVEAVSMEQLLELEEESGADIALVNFVPAVMPWLTSELKARIPTISILHNYEPRTLSAVMDAHSGIADLGLVLDPSIVTTDPRILVSSRPLPELVAELPELDSRPRIGSFGFAFPHKGFTRSAGEIWDTFGTEATFALHMTEAFFNGANGAPVYSPGILRTIEDAWPELRLELCDRRLEENEVVRQLARNHANLLLYDPGQPNAGRSSALDYLVAARRPILVTDCEMFRHFEIGISFWPKTRLAAIFEELERYQARAERLALESSALAWRTADLVEALL